MTLNCGLNCTNISVAKVPVCPIKPTLKERGEQIKENVMDRLG